MIIKYKNKFLFPMGNVPSFGILEHTINHNVYNITIIIFLKYTLKRQIKGGSFIPQP